MCVFGMINLTIEHTLIHFYYFAAPWLLQEILTVAS
jgi:hypothetical protein